MFTGASNKVDDDASDSDGRPSDDQSKATSGTEEGVDNGGVSHPSPTEELAQILFPESESSGEESGWIVSDSEDMTTSLAGMLEVRTTYFNSRRHQIPPWAV